MWNVRSSGCGMLEMWDVGDVRCWGCGMLGMWDVRDAECSRLGCSEYGMWNVGCLPRCGTLIYKIPFFFLNLFYL